MMVLNSIFDAGGTMDLVALRAALPATGRDLRKAIVHQRSLGNLRLCEVEGTLTLTASARAAIAAGRAHRPMMIMDLGGQLRTKHERALAREIAQLAQCKGDRAPLIDIAYPQGRGEAA
ncbi:hypothetical protein [Sphingobium lignivorans]|uniref:Uncharacterized protein n=1 Tax=Sphingobium lignivorans TaxID=2735886 RepID=A0ABR6NDJ8_9SPHN|nr:hypothetical protein [Sphingobium lignivorans]MBB5985331.1 hypothetical protein [Sphingobium lignivorans]